MRFASAGSPHRADPTGVATLRYKQRNLLYRTFSIEEGCLFRNLGLRQRPLDSCGIVKIEDPAGSGANEEAEIEPAESER